MKVSSADILHVTLTLNTFYLFYIDYTLWLFWAPRCLSKTSNLQAPKKNTNSYIFCGIRDCIVGIFARIHPTIHVMYRDINHKLYMLLRVYILVVELDVSRVHVTL